MIFLKEQLMHICKPVHRGDFHKNGKLTSTNFQTIHKLLHILKRDLDGIENFRKIKVFFGSFGIEGFT